MLVALQQGGKRASEGTHTSGLAASPISFALCRLSVDSLAQTGDAPGADVGGRSAPLAMEEQVRQTFLHRARVAAAVRVGGRAAWRSSCDRWEGQAEGSEGQRRDGAYCKTDHRN